MELLKDVAASLSHDELLEVTKSSLCTLMSCDPLLNDLPLDIITEEILLLVNPHSFMAINKNYVGFFVLILNLISFKTAVEHGRSITIFISRENEPKLKVIVSSSI